MTKIDIFSGFLGAGKTTLIKKLIQEAYAGQKVVLIENEFGEIGVDGGFLQDAGIEITEMNSGCICCSLVGDFAKALEKVLTELHPDRILIEPSGVGKLSDIVAAVERVPMHGVIVDGAITVADANKVKLYSRNFGEFYNNQIANAGCIVLSRTDSMKQDKLDAAVAILREQNPDCMIITTPWDQLDGKQILEAVKHTDTLEEELARMTEEEREHHHHHDDEECCCHDHEHEHHHHDDECCGHDHEHHHHHDDECCDHDHEHEHHHDHDEECSCGCHDHDHHHHHHHADEIFGSWGVETSHKFTREQIEGILEQLEEGKYGTVLRAKGIVAGEDGQWIYFDYVPGENNIRTGAAAVMGRLCVIGSKMDRDGLGQLFGV